MPTRHKLNAKKDAWFLEKNLRDPLTGQTFKAGDIVILCSVCHTAHHLSTWGADPERPCAMDCRNARPLHFRRFSQSILQQKAVQHKGFRTKQQSTPFLERLRNLDALPSQIVASLLLPLLVFLQLFLFVPQELGINRRQIASEALHYADAALDQVCQTVSANPNISLARSRAESAVPMLSWKAGMALSHIEEAADKAGDAVPVFLWKVKRAAANLERLPDEAEKVVSALQRKAAEVAGWAGGILDRFRD